MLRITRAAIDEMIEHARLEAPIEACGYLGAECGAAVEVFRMKNMDASIEHFSLNPEEQFAVIRRMRDSGLKPSAVYHSHPATPARPSDEDIRLAYDPDMSFVIVSLAGDEPSVCSFRIGNACVDDEEIIIIE